MSSTKNKSTDDLVAITAKTAKLSISSKQQKSGKKTKESDDSDDEPSEVTLTPEEFLRIIQKGDEEEFQSAMHQIKKMDTKEQKRFLTVTGKDEKDLLLVAAKRNMPVMTRKLVKLEDRLYSSKSLAKLLTQESGMKKAGRIPVTHSKTKLRPYRSFAKERERQLLRQIATQIYFGVNQQIRGQADLDIIGNLVEVEAMHLEFGDIQHLFIAANEYSVSQIWKKLIGVNCLNALFFHGHLASPCYA